MAEFDIGAQCSLAECRELDFLPFTCGECQQVFCLKHYKYEDHECAAATAASPRLVLCPMCNTQIDIEFGATRDAVAIAVNAHIDNECEVKQESIFKAGCNVGGCSKKEVLPILCRSCRKSYCLQHRHEDQHDCALANPGAGTTSTGVSGGVASGGGGGGGGGGRGPFRGLIPTGMEDVRAKVNMSKLAAANVDTSAGARSVSTIFQQSDAPLTTDVDEQLLIFITFSEPTSLAAMRVIGTGDGCAPKEIRLFKDNTSIDFDDAEEINAVQELELTERQALGHDLIELRFTKLQNINSLTLFVGSNQGDEEETKVCYLQLLGRSSTSAVGTSDLTGLKVPGQ